ncbi:MAG TPA: hypothetical protein GX692_03180 [Acholeplasmataceae bacterium]|nr:hypothetical protein [Acholeplasmataceae bacterium]
MVGKFVNHKKYGKGQVTKVIGNNNYYIKFEKQKKEIIFPLDSFTEEYFILNEDEKADNNPEK